MVAEGCEPVRDGIGTFAVEREKLVERDLWFSDEGGAKLLLAAAAIIAEVEPGLRANSRQRRIKGREQRQVGRNFVLSKIPFGLQTRGGRPPELGFDGPRRDVG
jgi:hypothetical protein